MLTTSAISNGTWLVMGHDDGSETRINISKVTSLHTNKFGHVGANIEIVMGADVVAFYTMPDKINAAIAMLQETIDGGRLNTNIVGLI